MAWGNANSAQNTEDIENLQNDITTLNSSVSTLNTNLTNNVNTLNTNINTKQPKINSGTITLTAAGWSGTASPYTQVVSHSAIKANVQVDLMSTSAIVSSLSSMGTDMIYIENNNGTATAYAVGKKPTSNLTVSATFTEVAVV